MNILFLFIQGMFENTINDLVWVSVRTLNYCDGGLTLLELLSHECAFHPHSSKGFPFSFFW